MRILLLFTPMLWTVLLATTETQLALVKNRSITTPVTGPYWNYVEGPPFPGTPEFCKHSCIVSMCPGFSFEPQEGTFIRNFASVFTTERGQCRLLTKSKNSTYIFEGAERWPFEIAYLDDNEEEQCPMGYNYVGLKNVIISGRPVYSAQKEKNVSTFCLGDGQLAAPCQSIPVVIGAKRIKFNNGSALTTQTSIFCNNRRSACGADVELWETAVKGLDGLSTTYHYSTKSQGSSSKLMCFVWDSKKC